MVISWVCQKDNSFQGPWNMHFSWHFYFFLHRFFMISNPWKCNENPVNITGICSQDFHGFHFIVCMTIKLIANEAQWTLRIISVVIFPCSQPHQINNFGSMQCTSVSLVFSFALSTWHLKLLKLQGEVILEGNSRVSRSDSHKVKVS